MWAGRRLTPRTYDMTELGCICGRKDIDLGREFFVTLIAFSLSSWVLVLLSDEGACSILRPGLFKRPNTCLHVFKTTISLKLQPSDPSGDSGIAKLVWYAKPLLHIWSMDAWAAELTLSRKRVVNPGGRGRTYSEGIHEMNTITRC